MNDNSRVNRALVAALRTFPHHWPRRVYVRKINLNNRRNRICCRFEIQIREPPENVAAVKTTEKCAAAKFNYHKKQTPREAATESRF